jgi:alpha-D-ribose 1-methylphosphonate 5-triphosphate synthase subunit PhnH
MLTAAFADPVLDAQATFRALLGAAAQPGTIAELGRVPAAPPPLSAGAAAIALTLCDRETPLWLDSTLLSSPTTVRWLRFHTGAPIIDDAGSAAFAFVGAPEELPPFDRFNQGTAEYPDRSTTIVLQVRSFCEGPRFALTGPGIRIREQMQVAPLPNDMLQRLSANRKHFPQGVDLLFATETRIMALPRTIEVGRGD